MTNYPPGAERALEEQAAETEAYNEWERMAESSGALEKLADIMIAAAHGEDVAVDGGPDPAHVTRAVRDWLDGHEELHQWFVVHELIQSFEEWRQDREFELASHAADEKRDARIADGR